MSQICPTCQTALDPTHAPVARVRGAKVVAYCSSNCAEASLNSSTVSANSKGSKSKWTGEGKDMSNIGVRTKAKSIVKDLLGDPRYELTGKDVTEEGANKSKSLSRGKRAVILAGAGLVFTLGCTALFFHYSKSSEEVNSTSIAQKSNTDLDTQSKVVEHVVEAEQTLANTILTPAALRLHSIKELELQLVSDSVRHTRLAAIALARLSHKDAVKRLSELFQTEESELSRLDISFGLARAGFEIGREHLVQELTNSRRDVRLDAARRLSQLGDDAGGKTLQKMLKVRSHRLGAATVLARLGVKDGMQVLLEEFEDSKASDENKMRAAVGLGLAGNKIAQEFLLTILAEGRYVVDAAGALAVLGDMQALPALENHLRLSALRVGAAEHLRTLRATVKLQQLQSGLSNGNAEGKISAAEAIIVLTEDTESQLHAAAKEK